MKRFLLFNNQSPLSRTVLSMFAIACMQPALAGDLTADGVFYSIDEAGGFASVRGYNYEEGKPDITIPATVNFDGKDYPVTEIMSNAFNGTGIQSFVMGENITTIGAGAFSFCTGLSGITIGPKVETIGDQAFYQCVNMTSLSLPSGVKSIGKYAFMMCPVNGEIDLPESLSTLGVAPFRATQVTAFRISSANTSYTAVDGVVFTKDMTELLMYPSGNMQSSYTVPQSVKTIAAESVRNIPLLSQVTLPSGLETIGEMAFASDNLLKVEIPASVSSIGRGAFFNNLNLSEITVASGNTVFKSQGGLLIENSANRIIAATSTLTDLNIPEGIAEVGEYAFYTHPSVVSVKMPSSMRTVGYAAFYGCPQLTTLDLGNGISEIGRQSFDNCSKLKTFDFPASLRIIGEQAFGFCHSIEKVMLNDGLEEMGANVFFTCDGISEVRVPGTMKKFGFSTFYQCTNLTKAVLCEGLAEIPDQMFNFCYNLEDLTVPSTIKRIGQSALYATAIESIDLPEGLEYIGYSAIYGTKIEELIIPNSVTDIDGFALAWNPRMKHIKLGSGVKRLGDYAITTMSALESVELNEGLEYIGSMGISYCDVMTSLTIPSTVTELGWNALVGSPFEKLYNLAPVPQVLDPEDMVVGDEEFNPIYDTCTLIVPDESVDAYRQAAVWKEFKNIIPLSASIEDIPAVDSVVDAEISEVYTLDGKRLASPRAGLNIVRMSDGSVRKILIRD